ncbi:hypothetical protein CARUB_v10009174mg [Capsella rubella]|uniref:Ion transport domain-containing protein n=1 Tax=Capsella rubella TaxID=81985 RepID=R0ID73_9BRAS|nr:probable cyclic nucleotide-gated ion channel 12 [Capsella rubella]EOA40449.1 hypothetical protein CARUB_v10009174mg [Capsella rubella]
MYEEGTYVHTDMNIQMTSSARSGTGNGAYEKIRTTENWRKAWRKCLLAVCGFALAIDTLFLFIPEINYLQKCIGFNEKLRTTVCFFRIFIDLLYVGIIIFSKTPLRGKMSGTKRLIYFIVDIVSLLPIPVVMVFYLRTEWSSNLVTNRVLKWTIVAQYLPRIIRIHPIYKAVTKTTTTIAESKWIGALLNLSLFLLCSYVFGAFWYVTAIEKRSRCWRNAWVDKTNFWMNKTNNLSGVLPPRNLTELYCAHLVDGKNNSVFLFHTCLIKDPEKIPKPSKYLAGIETKRIYDYGMYGEVVKSEVGSANLRDFPKKFFYCFWWGLRNLSTFGESLKPGNSATDIFLAIIICACGLFLVAVLIGNVQKYLLTSTVRSDEMLERKKDTEAWMTFRKLPEDLKKRIKENEKTLWKNVRGTDEESLLRRLPEELRRETQPYLLDD